MKYYINESLINDKIIKIVTIENSKGLKVSFLNLGAAIYNIYLDDLLLTVCGKDLNLYSFSGSPYGKTIGRVAGRIEDGIIDVDGINYELEKSKFGKDTLHCGTSNFGNKFFEFEVIEKGKSISIYFTYLSLENEAKLPGDVNVKVIYTIFEDTNKIKIEYVANSTKNTYLNITNHTYFNLSGNFRTGIENHYIMINAKHKAVTDNHLNPQSIEKCSKYFDFTTEKLLKDNLFTKEVLFRQSRGYDDAFVLDNKINNLAVSIYSPFSKIRMNLYTSYPGLILYTGSYPAFMEQVVDVENKYLFDSICLEPQYIPNGYKIFNKNYMYLEKTDTYNHYIELEFLKEEM